MQKLKENEETGESFKKNNNKINLHKPTQWSGDKWLTQQRIQNSGHKDAHQGQESNI